MVCACLSNPIASRIAVDIIVIQGLGPLFTPPNTIAITNCNQSYRSNHLPINFSCDETHTSTHAIKVTILSVYFLSFISPLPLFESIRR